MGWCLINENAKKRKEYLTTFNPLYKTTNKLKILKNDVNFVILTLKIIPQMLTQSYM